MSSHFSFLDFIMKFIYIFCHCQQNTFSKNIRCAATQISAKLHILFQFTKRSFCLDASVYSKKNSFVRENPFQILLSIFQKCFCHRKHFVSFFYWCFTVVPFDTFFLVRTIFTSKVQIKYPKEYPCQIKVRTSVTPENIFLIYIVDYIIRLLGEFSKILQNYIGKTYSTEKVLIDEYKRAFCSFARKNYFKECAVSLDSIKKKYGDIFPENIINAIKIRAAKGKIRNYQSYEKIFEWYWKYKKGSVIFDTKRTLDILRYSDDFCNRLFE